MGSRRHRFSFLALALPLCGGAAGCDSSWPYADDPVDEPATPSKKVDGGVPRPSRIDAGFDFIDSSLPRPSFDASVSVPARLAQLTVADHPPPSISGGTLTVSSAGDLAVAADPDRDALYLISLLDAQVRTVQFPQGSEPGRVLLDTTGGVHVALRSSGVVARVDSASASVLVSTKACQLPRGLAHDASKNELLIACASGELVVLDATTHAEHTRTFIDLDLRDVVVGKGGERFVSRYRSAELLQLGADGKVLGNTQPMVSKAQRFDFQPDIGATTSEVKPLPPSIALTGGGRIVSLSATLAWRLVGMPDGSFAMLHQQSQDDEVVISQAGGYGGGCQPITQPAITCYDAHGKPQREPALLGGGALMVDVAVSPDGRYFALAKPGEYLRDERGTLEVLSTLASSDSSLQGMGAPTLKLDADGGIVTDFDPSRPSPTPCNVGLEVQTRNMQTTAVAFDGSGKLYAFSREPARLTVYELGKLDDFNAQPIELETIELSAKSVSDTGHDLFHGDVGTGLACASCHGEALDDGHVWNFKDFGPRRTQNMRGGFLSTLPLHWEGDLSSFQKLVDEVMTRRMGGFKVEPELATALANWIDKQPAVTLGSTDAAASARGKLLFESPDLQCSTCHTGSTLTNDQTLDVGTGGLFQVPSLRGLGLRAPYMHDGCAVTLSDRFDPTCGGGDRHGKTSQLTAAQIADLVAYLLTL
ncbi:MAG: hypothetical protein JWN48_3007 [Myxococcaceae bacterium]|nr:hypothetical protein [Myxococcaceae bacterium]